MQVRRCLASLERGCWRPGQPQQQQPQQPQQPPPPPPPPPPQQSQQGQAFGKEMGHNFLVVSATGTYGKLWKSWAGSSPEQAYARFRLQESQMAANVWAQVRLSVSVVDFCRFIHLLNHKHLQKARRKDGECCILLPFLRLKDFWFKKLTRI